MSEADIQLYEPCLRGNEKAYIDECLKTNFVSSVGPFVERFEKEFAAFVGAKHAVACSTGTAAIHVALRLLGIGQGDDVAVPSMTFIASANPIVYEKATPVLVDSEARTLNMDAGRVIEEMDCRARTGQKQLAAVLAVHILGHPAELEELVTACDKHGVHLIEDAAEALGARYVGGRFAGKHVGTIGKLGCYSFNGNKIITTGGGGMIATDDAALAKRAKHLTTQARLPGAEYQHDEVGYNYRLTNLAAALGVAQLEELPAFLRTKKAQAARYDEALASIVDLPPRQPWAEPTFWLYTIGLRDADRTDLRTSVWKKLTEHRVHTRPIWTPLHTQAPYRDAPRLGGEVAEKLFARALSIPSSVHLTEPEQARVVERLREALA